MNRRESYNKFPAAYAYFEWILDDKLMLPMWLQRTYTRLLHQLYTTEFHCELERDQNRIQDGLRLREEYFDLVRLDLGIDNVDFFGTHCSVLELLAALSIRMDREYSGSPGEEEPDDIFWQLIKNLGLDRFRDSHPDWSIGEADRIIDCTLNRWMYRKFFSNGNGSIFPIQEPFRDQRTIEIWSQMNDYISEMG